MGKKTKQAPIFVAASKGDDEAVQDILRADASQLTAKNKDGWQPLHTASYWGNLRAVKVLVEAGADVNAGCNDKDTPVHYASAQGHCNVIRFLASKGANLSAKDRDGETPADVSGKNKDAKTLIEALLRGEDGGSLGMEKEDSEEEWETDEGDDESEEGEQS